MTIWRRIVLVERNTAGVFVRRNELLFGTTGTEVQGTLISAGLIDANNVNAQRGRTTQLHSTSRLAGAITRRGSIYISSNDYSAIVQQRLRVFVIPCVGQSNEVGHGVIADYPIPFPDAAVGNRIWMRTYSDDLMLAAEPINDSTNNLWTQFNTGIPDGSPLIQICETLAQSVLDAVFVIVPCCMGGTTSTEWLVNDAITSLYGAIPFRTNAVCQELLNAGAISVEVPFMFLGQGESNGQDSTLASSWASDWNGILNQFELDISDYLPDEGLRVIYAQVSPTMPPGIGFTQVLWDQLRTTQATLQSAKRFMITKPDGPLVDTIHLNWGKSTGQGLYKVGNDAGLMAITQGLI